MRTWRNEEQIVEKQKKRHHTKLGSSAVFNIAYEREWKKINSSHFGRYSTTEDENKILVGILFLELSIDLALIRVWPYFAYYENSSELGLELYPRSDMIPIFL